ncbi:hypothetical protein WA158_007451 [Blastocystis sp. Blastoise]
MEQNYRKRVTLSCEIDEIELVVLKHYTEFPQEESFEIWQGSQSNGTQILKVQGTKLDEQLDRNFTICTKPIPHTIYMYDNYGDGWGSISGVPYIRITMNSAEVFKGWMYYKPGTSYKEDSKTFLPRLSVDYGSQWLYTDEGQDNLLWTYDQYDDSTWHVVLGGHFPSFTSLTRYYRYHGLFNIENTFSTLMYNLKVNEGFILYLSGTELYRYKLPEGQLNSTIPSLFPRDIRLEALSFTINKYLLNKNTNYTLCIEVHQYNNTQDIDIFDVSASLYGPVIDNQCSNNRFFDGKSIGIFSTGKEINTDILFDNILSTYLISETTSKLNVTYQYRSGRSELLNSYSITCATIDTYGHPSKWNLYGSKDGILFDLLDIQESIVFHHSSETQLFSLRSNMQSYSIYRFEFLESSVPNKVALGLLGGHICQYPYLSSDLYYNEHNIEGYSYVTNVLLYPITQGYHSFSSTPSLPTGLTLNNHTGLISGIVNIPIQQQYRILAYNIRTGLPSYYNITIHMNSCSLPEKSLIHFRKTNKDMKVEESWRVETLNGTVLYISPKQDANLDTTDSICIDTQVIKVILEDSFDEGWNKESRLYIEQMNNNHEYITLGILYEYISYSNIYYFDTSFLVPSSSSKWSYIQGNIPDKWASLVEPSEFEPFSFLNPINTTSTYWLFRHLFTYIPLEKETGIEIKVYCRAGFVLFINEEEVFRYYISNGPITVNTTAIAGELNPIYYTITLPLSSLLNGTNILAIGIFNLQGNLPPTIQFETIVKRIMYNDLGIHQDLSVTSTPAGNHIENIIDFDVNSYWSASLYPYQSASIHFYYGKYRFLYINKYCITSSQLPSSSDLSDWAIYGGQNGGESYVLLANVTNACFSERKKEICFYLPQNHYSYNEYLLYITKNAKPSIEPYSYSFTEIMLSTIDMNTVSLPPLSYSPSTLVGYINNTISTSLPSSEYYNYFNITPELPSGFYLDSSTGIIHGVSTQVFSNEYTITALNPKGNEYSTTITITITLCDSTNNLVLLTIFGGNDADQMGIEFIQQSLSNESNIHGYSDNSRTQSVYLNITHFWKFQKHTYPLCIPTGLYIFNAFDSEHNGWDQGYFNLQTNSGINLLDGSMGKNEDKISFPIYVGYLFDMNQQIWHYQHGVSDINSQWMDPKYDDSTWEKNTISYLSQPTGISQYYRTSFNLESLDKTAVGLQILVNNYAGMILYINGEEIRRVNMPNNIINATTLATHEYSTYKLVSLSYLLSNLPLHKGTNTIAIEFHMYKSLPAKNYFRVAMRYIVDQEYRVLDGVGTTNQNSIEDHEPIYLYDNRIQTVSISGPLCSGSIYTWTFNSDSSEQANVYSVSNGQYCNNRTPSGWILKGSVDNIHWDILDVQENQLFKYYHETKYYTFYPSSSYTIYQFITTECENTDIYINESCGNEIYIQLADLGFYMYNKTPSCIATTPYTAGYDGIYSYVACDIGYEGVKRRLCSNGQYQKEENFCTLIAPVSIHYSTSHIIMNKMIQEQYSADIIAAEYIIQISPDLPKGLSIDNHTGMISGIPLVYMNETEYIVSVSNSIGSFNTTITIAITQLICASEGDWSLAEGGQTISLPCEDTINYEGSRTRTCDRSTSTGWGAPKDLCSLIPAFIQYPSSNINGYIRKAIEPMKPTIKGGKLNAIHISPDLPAGFSFDIQTGLIGGIPITMFTQVYNITASNAISSSSFLLTISISTYYCPPEGEWPQTMADTTCYIYCKEGELGIRTRRCVLSSTENDAYWDQEDNSYCIDNQSIYTLQEESILVNLQLILENVTYLDFHKPMPTERFRAIIAHHVLSLSIPSEHVYITEVSFDHANTLVTITLNCLATQKEELTTNLSSYITIGSSDSLYKEMQAAIDTPLQYISVIRYGEKRFWYYGEKEDHTLSTILFIICIIIVVLSLVLLVMLRRYLPCYDYTRAAKHLEMKLETDTLL